MNKSGLQQSIDDELSPVATLGTFLFFIFLFLITHEVSLQDSLQLCGILVLDMATGAIVWMLLSRKTQYSIFELFGVGVALGTSLNTIGQLIFRGSRLGTIFNYVFLLLVVSIFLYLHRKREIQVSVEPTRHTFVLAVCATALVLLCGDRYYLWAGVLILFLGVFVAKRVVRSTSGNRINRVYFGISFGAIAVALISASILERIIFGHRSTTSYIGSWDDVYVEASSRSLINYGPFDNVFLANTKNAYYWFSYAWSGAITERSIASDWIVNTQFGFILLALTTISVVAAILLAESTDKRVGHLSLFVVASTSLIGSTNFLMDTGSFSQCVSIMFLVLAFFFARDLLSEPRFFVVLILVFTLCILILTKLTIAIPVLSGFGLFSIFIWLFKTSIKQRIYFSVSMLASGGSSLLLFYIFIKQQTEFQNSQSDFTFGPTRNAFGISTGVLMLDIGLLLVYRVPILFFLIRNHGLFIASMISVAFTSLFMAVTIESAWVNQANTYLLVPLSLASSLMISIWMIRERLKLDEVYSQFRQLFFVVTIIGGCLGFAATFRLSFYDLNFVASNKYYFVSSLIPLISVAPICAIVFLTSDSSNRRKFISSFLIVAFVSSSTGSFVAHSLRSVERSVIYAQNHWDLVVEDIEVPISKLQGAIVFISTNVSQSDVLADNSSNNILISARTGVRSYASTYGKNYSTGHDDRYIAQTQFAENPDVSNYEYLRDGCVTWFYFDKGDVLSTAKSFEPYAITKYEDDYGAVLKLSDDYPLHKDCLK